VRLLDSFVSHKSFRPAQIIHNRFSKRSPHPLALHLPSRPCGRVCSGDKFVRLARQKGGPTFTYENQSESWDCRMGGLGTESGGRRSRSGGNGWNKTNTARSLNFY